MRENPTEVVVGGAVLAFAVGFLIYVWQTAGGGGFSGSYPLTASFRSVEGVSQGSDIRLAGVKIGTVSKIELNQETFRGDATLAILDDIQIPDDSAAVVASEGLLGGNFIEIVPGGSLDNLESGAEILDTQGAVSLISLLLRFAGGDSE